MDKTVRKRSLHDPSGKAEDLAYWLSKTPEERIAAVEELRRQRHGTEQPFHRVVRIIQRKPR